jgi:predicted nuclease of predicted toxin-antitoxin system
MKILVDMNLSPMWVRFLAEAGFEAVHWSEIGAHDATDTHLLEWAFERDYIVLTNDLDFGAILAATQRRRPSVVQLRGGNLSPSALGDAILTAIGQVRQELLDGALVSVDLTRARVRILPIQHE